MYYENEVPWYSKHSLWCAYASAHRILDAVLLAQLFNEHLAEPCPLVACQPVVCVLNEEIQKSRSDGPRIAVFFPSEPRGYAWPDKPHLPTADWIAPWHATLTAASSAAPALLSMKCWNAPGMPILQNTYEDAQLHVIQETFQLCEITASLQFRPHEVVTVMLLHNGEAQVQPDVRTWCVIDRYIEQLCKCGAVT